MIHLVDGGTMAGLAPLRSVEGARGPKEFVVRMLPVTDIRPYPRNPRRNAEAVEKVMRSLLAFGWQQPITVDGEMVIVAGHTRYAAAQRLGWTVVPVFVAAHLTASEAKAYRLADNRTGEEAEWEFQLLGEELAELLLEGKVDMSITGFAEPEIEGHIGLALLEGGAVLPSNPVAGSIIVCPDCGCRFAATHHT